MSEFDSGANPTGEPPKGYGWTSSGGWTNNGQPSSGPQGEDPRQGTPALGGGYYDERGNVVNADKPYPRGPQPDKPDFDPISGESVAKGYGEGPRKPAETVEMRRLAAQAAYREKYHLSTREATPFDVPKESLPRAKEQAGKAKEAAIIGAEFAVPGVYTGRHWTEMDTGQKVLNVGIDIASILVPWGIAKGIGAGIKPLTKAGREAAKLAQAAKAAGEAGQELAQTRNALNKSAGKVGTTQLQKLAAARNAAAEKAVSTHIEFTSRLSAIDSVSTRQIRKLEKASNIKGLANALAEVKEANAQMRGAISTRNTEKIVIAQNRLSRALSNAGSTLDYRAPGSVKLTPGEPAPRIETPGRRVPVETERVKGYKMVFEDQPKPTIKVDKTTGEQIDTFLRNHEPANAPWKSKGGVAVAEAAEPKGKHGLKLEPITEKTVSEPRPQVKEAPVPKEGKRTSAFPGIKDAGKPFESTAVSAIPAEAFGRMTSAQIAEHYGVDQDVVDAVGKSIEEHQAALQGKPGGAPLSDAAAAAAYQAGTGAYHKAKQRGETKAKAKVEAKAAAKEALKEQTKAQTAGRVRVGIRTRTPVKPPRTPYVPPKPPTSKQPLRRPPPPLPMPHTTGDRERRERIKKVRGAIAFNMGELGKQRIWHVVMYPFQGQEDYTQVVGRAPVGATIVSKGPGSAYRTAQLLYGRTMSKELAIDIGVQDAVLTPTTGGKGVSLSFKPDPHMTTTGDIDISKSGGVFPLEGKR